MNKKYYSYSGGRVGGACPPYRDHQFIVNQNISCKCVGLDTPLTPALAGGAREEHSGLLDQRGVL